MNILNKTYEVIKSDPIDEVKRLVNTSEEIICLFQKVDDEVDLKFVAVSCMVSSLLGCSQEEILKSSPKEFIINKDEFQEYVSKVIDYPNVTFESDLLLIDNQKLSLKVNTIRFSIENEMFYICFAVEKSRTFNKLYEKYFLNNLDMYKKIVEMMGDSVFVEQGERVVYSNLAGARLLGETSRYNLIGKRMSDYLIPELKSEWTELREGSELYKSSVLAVDHRCKRKSGKLIDLDISSVPISYQDDECVISVIRDITSKKTCERNLKRAYDDKMELINKMIEYDNQKTEFFSNISHEFKTPLNVILGSLQLIESYGHKGFESLDDENYETHRKIYKNLDVMKQNCYRLLRLINNLIDANKVDADFIDMYFRKQDVVNVIENITLSIVEYANNKNIVLIFDTDVEEKYMVFDEEKMERIMLNLLSNALKFTPKNGVICVELKTFAAKIRITVKDSGVGIPEVKLKDIFSRFEQVKYQKRNREGSGIGLYLVKSLVELHGGKIWVDSTLGVGTTFYIDIPTDIIANIESHKKEKNEPDIIERLTIEFSDIYSS